MGLHPANTARDDSSVIIASIGGVQEHMHNKRSGKGLYWQTLALCHSLFDHTDAFEVI